MKDLKQMALELYNEALKQGLDISTINFTEHELKTIGKFDVEVSIEASLLYTGK